LWISASIDIHAWEGDAGMDASVPPDTDTSSANASIKAAIALGRRLSRSADIMRLYRSLAADLSIRKYSFATLFCDAGFESTYMKC
jgi:hypothetical protein